MSRLPVCSLLLGVALAAPTFAQPQIGGGTCSTASLNGKYATTMAGRQVSSSGTFSNIRQANGVATFDGLGNVALSLTANTNISASQPLKANGTYNISSNCSGTVSIATGDPATMNLVVYNQGKAFLMTGADDTLNLSLGGTLQPATCLTASLSGVYAFNGNGFTFNGTSIAGVTEVSGLLQFDGQSKVIANWNVTAGTTMSTVAANGTYAVNTPTSCLGAATLADSSGKAYSLTFSITDATGADFQLIGSSSQSSFMGTAHSSFLNPSQSVSNGASFKAGETAPGSIFSIFGQNLGPNPAAYSGALPLLDTLGTTRVTVNGNAVPLFYSGTGQINAQMPVHIAPGLVTIAVTNGGATSNAVAVMVPEVAPGIFVNPDNKHAVVINPDSSANSASTPAHVGDTVVAYFTGGGPVTPSGAWNTGDASPLGQSPVTEDNSVAVNGTPAQVIYVGLTGGSVGLYQANFVVPQVAAGEYPLVINIGGVASPAAFISIAD